MRSTAIILVYAVSIFLVFFVALTQMDVRFDLVFYAMVLGQFLVGVMVYMVLKDNYKTDKTFDHWYEDHPNEIE
ncbi:hypothetical protein [Robertkochia sediminum]|uniref:hypothetical protein n=1 Tax=Robertkochia sediminum TaxID=2785326 RepID=UPI001931B371|nr:hypothetical protein [Robertkochia sediminum]MBL7473532.1 hypothetical protein [Robertkochia sediminum]